MAVPSAMLAPVGVIALARRSPVDGEPDPALVHVPARYTPGTKMPEQRIGSEQDRAALVLFLERATKR